MQPIKVYTPIKFDFRKNISEFILRRNPEMKKGRVKQYVDNQSDKYKYFGHFIYFRTVTNKKATFSDYIEISSDHFGKLLGSDYFEHITDFYLEYGIVECDNTFYHNYGNVIRSKCKGYRFTEKFRNENRMFFQDILINENFESKLRLQNFTRANKLDIVSKNVYFHLQDIRIKYDEALDFVINQNNEAVEALSKTASALEVTEDEFEGRVIYTASSTIKKEDNAAQAILDRFNSRFTSILNIYNEDWFIVRDNTGRRIHTNLTNLSKELKPFLYTVHQKDLFQVDVRNSQPFLFISIINEYYNGLTYSTSTAKYVDLVSKGKFYNYLCDYLGITDAKEIDEFKRVFFGRVFYCANHQMVHNKEFKTFQKLFPDLATIIFKEKIVKHEALSIKMQLLESSIIADKVLPVLYSKYKDKTFINPIHDCVIVEEELIEEVEALIKLHYTEACGTTPSVKISRLEEENFNGAVAEIGVAA